MTLVVSVIIMLMTHLCEMMYLYKHLTTGVNFKVKVQIRLILILQALDSVPTRSILPPGSGILPKEGKYCINTYAFNIVSILYL